MTGSAAYTLAAGLLAAVAWAAPLIAPPLAGFPAHMLRHMAVVAGIAPLLALVILRLPDPRPRRWLGVPPMIAAGAEFAIVWGWHLPGLQAWAGRSDAAYALQLAMFLGAGLAVWGGALVVSPLLGAGTMLLTSMHMTLLGALLILAPAPLYGQWADLWGQQVGGMLMLGIGTPIYLIAGLRLVSLALRSKEPRHDPA
ncbi:cytochrome c oxidase assembly protein [Brevirhabdus sp.]|uniref:cytochrome c oxidase assembly protein n=1 Tax=Brevirhabdus sp. TaxID=2004514 RepID=UPI004059A78A